MREVRSTDMKATSQEQQNPETPPKWRRKGMFIAAGLVGIPLLLATLLSSSSVQRWVILRVLEVATESLPPHDGPIEFGMESVGIDWKRIGISLNGLYMIRPGGVGTVDTLATLSQVSILPQDRTGLHWSHIALDGLEVSELGLEWAKSFDSTEGNGLVDTAFAFRIDRLDLANVRIPSPSDSMPRLYLELEKHHMEGLDISGTGFSADTIWGQAKLMECDTSLQETTIDELNWSGNKTRLLLEGHTTPDFWLAGLEIPQPWLSILPDDWSIDLDLHSSSAQVRLEDEQLNLTSLWNLRDGKLALLSAQLDHKNLTILPAGLPQSGQLELEGPLSMALDSAISSDLTPGPEGEVSLLWKGLAPYSTEIGIKWTPQTGEAMAFGRVAGLDTSLRRFAADFELEGRVPNMSELLENPSGFELDLGGDWQAEREGAIAGTGALQGEVEVQLKMGVEPRIAFSALARSAPLTVSESLELWGQWSLDGETTLALGPIGPEDWWTHLELRDARFISKASEGERVAMRPPISMDRLLLAGRGDGSRFTVDIDGDFAEGHISGPLEIQHWTSPLVSLLESSDILTPSEADQFRKDHLKRAPDPWDVQLTIWRDDLLERISGDEWSIGPGSHIQLNQTDRNVQWALTTPHLHVGPIEAFDLSLQGHGGMKPIALDLQSNRIAHRQYGDLLNLRANTAVALDDHSILSASWEGAVPTSFALEHHLLASGEHRIVPLRLQWAFENAHWQLDTSCSGDIRWRHGHWTSLHTEPVLIRGNRGSIRLELPDSTLYPGSVLSVQLERFPVGPWMDLLGMAPGDQSLPDTGSGNVNGNIRLGNTPLDVAASIEWEDAAIDRFQLGDICLEGQWNGHIERLELEQFVEDRRVLEAQWRGNDRISIELDAWPLDLLDPALSPAGVNVWGHTTGALELAVDSNLTPSLEGVLDLAAKGIAIEATGMEYGLSGTLDFEQGFIGMDRAVVTDPLGAAAKLNLSVLHDAFRDWNYDIGLELETPFEVMDLRADPGRLFYGAVIATGEANVFGDVDRMELTATVRSQEGTRFTMPLDALEGPDMPSGISFKGAGNITPLEEERTPPFEVSMALELEITPEAQVAMVLDQASGERVDGRANGSLSLVQSLARPLAMEGGLEIEQGLCRFSLRDLFTKNIAIAPGGRIDWDGDPYGAELDLRAVAPMRASPIPLMPDLVERGQTDVTEVEVGMAISGALSQPALGFDIRFPSYEEADPARLAQVNAALSTPEETERQAFALLATGQFIPPDQQNAQLIGISTATQQASDLVSAGVSELLSSLSDDVDIGLRYVASNGEPTASSDPGVMRSEDAFEMDLGLNLLNDRLRISGTLGAQGVDGSGLDNTDLRGAFDVRYRLTADGRWELIGYRKPESELDQEPRQGIGAIYQVRFDRLTDLFRGKENGSDNP